MPYNCIQRLRQITYLREGMPVSETSTDKYLDGLAEITTTDSKGDLTSSETKMELSISNPKYFDLLNKGELHAYYVGTQIRVLRSSVVKYKVQHAFIPRKSA